MESPAREPDTSFFLGRDAKVGSPGVDDLPVAWLSPLSGIHSRIVDQGRGRVVIVSVSPEIADLAAATLKRLGHDPVAAVAARRMKLVPGLVALNAVGELQETDVVVAPDKGLFEPAD